jgi:hypothetical protein
MSMSPRLLRPRATGFTPTDADARAYVAAVRAADGQPLEDAVERAIDAFVIGCKADGVWDAIKASCILCGARTLAGINVPLKGASPTFNAFTASEYNRKTGLIGNGSTMWIDSGRNNNADPQDSKHLSVWRTSAATVDGGLIGSNGVSNGDSHIFTGFGAWYFRNNAATAEITNTSFATANIFASISRSAAASFSFQISTTSGTAIVTSQTPRNANIRVFESGGRSNARLAFYSIGEALTLSLLGGRVSTLVSAIGAAIP